MYSLTSLKLLGLVLILSPAISFAQATTESVGPFDGPDFGDRRTRDWKGVKNNCPTTARNSTAAWKAYCDDKDGRENENTVEHEVTIGECRYKVSIVCYNQVDYEPREAARTNGTDFTKGADGVTMHLTADACNKISSVPKCDPPTMTLIEGNDGECNDQTSQDKNAIFSFEVYVNTVSSLSTISLE